MDDPKTLAAFVLEEFSERAGRDVDARENGAFSVRPGGPLAPGEQRRYRGAEAPWAKLTAAEVLDARMSPESTRAAGRRLGVDPKTISNLRRGVHYVTETTRPRCPACRAELNWPNLPQVPGCRPHCPRYGRTLRAPLPIPFTAAPVPEPQQKPKSFGESGHTWHDAAPMLDRVRAWEALERACVAWAQHRDEAVRGATSPLALLRLESEIEIATRALRKLRGDQR